MVAGRLKPAIAPGDPDTWGYFYGVVGRGNIDAFAQGLGPRTGELLAQLDTGTVREGHWPAILKAEKEGLCKAEIDQPALGSAGRFSTRF